MSRLLHAPDGLRPWARHLAGWMLAALWLATLAPAISRALSAGPPLAGAAVHWVELCTSQGMQWVRADPGGAPGAETPVPEPGALDRCGHCTLATERFAPLIPQLPVLPPAQAPWVSPSAVPAATVDAPARAAVARGPPLPG
jgi:hypothetical protein